MKKERRKTVLIQYIFHSFSAQNFVTRSSTKGVYFRMCAQKGWVKEGPGDEGDLPVNGPPAVSSYTTLPYSPCSPWLQVEWKKTVLEFDITARKRVRIPIEEKV